MRPSRRERRSLMYSEWAQTNGQAEPVGFPGKSSRSGIGGPSQTCSGMRRLAPAGESSIRRRSASANSGRPAAIS